MANPMEHLFESLDANKNGYLSLNEIEQSLNEDADKAQVQLLFKKADVNNDGKLDLEEFTTFVELSTNVSAPRNEHSLFVGTRGVSGDHTTKSNPSPLPPIILVPGLAGSVLRSFNAFGTAVRQWFPVDLLAVSLNLEVKWTDGKATSKKKIETLPGLEGVSDLSVEADKMVYFKPLISYFKANYSDVDKALDAAPYDWRLIPEPDIMRVWCEELKGKVDTLFAANGGKKVTLLGHSLGNLMILYFLNNYINGVDPTWKSTHIASYIGASPPYGGAPIAMNGPVTGVTFNGISVPANLLATFPSIAYLAPRPSAFADTPIVTRTPLDAPKVEYTTSDADYRKLYTDAGRPESLAIKENLVDHLFNLVHVHPGVKTHQILSSGVATPIKFEYKARFTGFLAPPPNIIKETGDRLGDGVVPYVSLHSNDSWLSGPTASLTSQVDLPNLDHNSIVGKPEFFTAVSSFIATL